MVTKVTGVGEGGCSGAFGDDLVSGVLRETVSLVFLGRRSLTSVAGKWTRSSLGVTGLGGPWLSMLGVDWGGSLSLCYWTTGLEYCL